MGEHVARMTTKYIWKWNEVDTSQFSLDSGDGAISVGEAINDPSKSPALILTASTVNVKHLWIMNENIALPNRFLIVATINNINNGICILPYYQDSTHFVGVGRATDQDASLLYANGTAGATVGNAFIFQRTMNGTFVILECQKSVSTIKPQFRLKTDTFMESIVAGNMALFHSGTAAESPGVNDIYNLDHAGWNNVSANKLAIGINASQANFSGSASISSLAILTHPLDYSYSI